MESQEIRNSDLSVSKCRSGFHEGNMCAHRCISPKTVEEIILSPSEGKESSIKRSSSSGEEDSTPLRVVRVRRQSLHSIDLNTNSLAAVKTPVTNGKKTPVRVPVNPFDAVLMDKLHLPICSPSIFTKIPEHEEKEFDWDIDQRATLFPAPIEEELHIHHCMQEHYDSEIESKLQDAIDRFYEGSRVIAPSPWIAAKKCGLERKLINLNSESDFSPRPQAMEGMACRDSSSHTTQDASTQTQLSLPFHLPPELECALQKYILPVDGDSGSASSSMIAIESESFSTSTRRKLFNAEDMSISQVDSTHIVSLTSPAHNASILPKTASSSPIKGGTILADFHTSSQMDEDEIHTGVLESSQTTFWKATASPSISPIASHRLPPYPHCSPLDGTRMKKKYDDLQSQYTPPSSRTRPRTLLPYSFAPLLEKDEEVENDKLNKDGCDEIAQNYVKPSPNSKNKEFGQNVDSLHKLHDFGGSKSMTGILGFSSIPSKHNATNVAPTVKVNTISISQYQNVSHGANERFDSLDVDDTCTSRMQDTGYQTISMTALPQSSLSSNSLKPKNGITMPLNSGSLADKITSYPAKICDDSYMSLSFNKIPHESVYNDESMTDVWHSSPPPLASSTPAKNFGGFLM
ncbi:serine-rich adhesin for platelets [Hetaerina americana]|uniref:serine-rich adhesin for platelets n=1 Tax=Hetaerina americana TaxID=62018 RepID=UPI003A7F5FCD